MSLFEELAYDDAQTLLNDLSPLARVWTSTGGQSDPNRDGVNWIFRGHSDDSWPLSPRAMRKGAFVHYGIGGVRGPVEPNSLSEQLEAERDEVGRFVDRCIRAGLSIPEDSQWFRNHEILGDVFHSGRPTEVDKGAGFPLHITRSLYALAQHHGAPTRLLDWSETPLVATYFACRHPAEVTTEFRKDRRERNREAILGGVSLPPEPEPAPYEKRLAIWALRQLAFGYLSEAVLEDQNKPTIETVRAPYESNPNLRAQKGLFTLVRYFTPRQEDDFRLPPIEDIIRDYEKSHPYADGPWLRKMTLPQSKAPQLLRLLDRFNINASTIYPSYNSVMPSIWERQFWE